MKLPRRSSSLETFLLLIFVCSSLLYQWTDGLAQQALPSANSPATFYSQRNGDDLGLIHEAAIRRAKRSILILMYTLSDHGILQALRDQANQGCSVTVIHHPKDSGSISLGRKVRTIPHPSKGLMHQKIMVIDEEEVWIGSANFTRASLKHHANLCMGIHSKELAALIQHRADRMQQSRRLPQTGGWVLNNMEVWFLPDLAVLDRVVKLIDSAEKTIRVAMYTWTHPRLAQACIDAHNRGVDVKCIIDGEAAAGSSKLVKNQLHAAGVPLRTSKGPALLHHKFALIDDTTLIHGSANWTRAAFKRNDEVLCVMHELNCEQSARVESTWTKNWNRSRSLP